MLLEAPRLLESILYITDIWGAQSAIVAESAVCFIVIGKQASLD